MSHFNTILTKIKTAVSDSSVATAASLSSAEWTNYHVFDGGRAYTHGQNRGRVPFANIWRTTSDYSFDSVGSTSNDQGGELISSWNIEIIVAKSSASDERTGEEQAYSIAEKILKAIRTDYNLALGNERMGEIENHPFGLSLKIELTINNSYSNSER